MVLEANCELSERCLIGQNVSRESFDLTTS